MLLSGNGLSAMALKKLALISMVMDHVGVLFLTIRNGAPFFKMAGKMLRIPGRLAFPIYVFLLVEGFIYTRSRRRYAGRLLLFGLISEIPYDLLLKRRIVDISCQNVYFELFICLLVLIGLETGEKRTAMGDPGGSPIIVLSVWGGTMAAELLHADYGIEGVLFTAIFYLFRYKNEIRCLLMAIMGFLCSWSFGKGAAVLSAIPVWLYNGTRERNRRGMFFYWFYPAHILLLILIRQFIEKWIFGNFLLMN